MASSIDFVEYVVDCLHPTGIVRYRKMFGEYMVYVNDKPLVLVCDNTAFVKKNPCLDELMSNAEVGFPYEGSKESYVLDIENSDLVRQVIALIEPVTKVPKPKTKKKKL